MSGTSVYAVSVDSRSRNPDEPDNAYTIQLQRTLARVQSVQLQDTHHFIFKTRRAREGREHHSELTPQKHAMVWLS